MIIDTREWDLGQSGISDMGMAEAGCGKVTGPREDCRALHE